MVELKETSYPVEILNKMIENSSYKLSKDLNRITSKVEAEKNTVLNILEEI